MLKIKNKKNNKKDSLLEKADALNRELKDLVFDLKLKPHDVGYLKDSVLAKQNTKDISGTIAELKRRIMIAKQFAKSDKSLEKK